VRHSPDPRRRVAFLVDGFNLGGTELNAVRTAEGIDRARYDLVVLGMSRRGPLGDRYVRAGYPIIDFSFRGLRHPDVVPMTARLAFWLRTHRIDVLHCHDKYSNMFGALCGRLAGVPNVITSRRFHVYGERRLEIGNKMAYRICDRVLANSDGVKRILESEGIVGSKITVVPNFLDDAAFAPAAPDARERFLNELGVPGDALVVGCVARLDPVKDHETLMRAFAGLVAQVPHAVLVLVGDGPRRAALEAFAAEIGIAHAVRFAGHRDNGTNLHQAFDISTLASVSEGFPNAVLEALAAGVPVVATDVGAVRDVIESGVTGYVVPARDVGAFAAALIALAADADLRRRLGASGCAIVSQRYRRGPILEMLYALWDEKHRRDGATASSRTGAAA
jgi:glycosyltransferase involved in cell wall biosynthesis